MVRLMSIFVFFFFSSAILAKDGSALFHKLGCHSCHDAVKDQVKRGLGPSIAMIKEHYKGKLPELLTFLKGQGKPVVYPERFELMKMQLEKIKDLNEKDRTALARFLLK